MSGQDDDGFDRLLRGEIPGTPTERELGAFVDDVREAFPAQPVLAEDVHLTRITEAAHLLADKGDPVARPVSNASGRAGHASGLPKRRRATVRVPVLKSLAAKVVAGLVVLMSMFGGMAFAGALPSGVQDKVANAVAAVVDLPGGQDEAEEPAEPVEVESEAPDPIETETETDDQGEDGDDQGEDESSTETETETESDDQGEESDDQDEDESSSETKTETESDDQGEDGDDQGEDDESESDDQDEDESSTETETETESDDQDVNETESDG